LEKLFGIHNGPKISDQVWNVLEKHVLKTPEDVRNALRGSKLKNKHYDCIRIFCDIFTPIKTQVNRKLLQTLLDNFDFLHNRWLLLKPSGSFFSYDWLIRQLLEESDSPLLIYLKPRTCKKRHLKYLTLFEYLYYFKKMKKLIIMRS